MVEALKEIFSAYEGEKGAVIPILQKVQAKLGFLSPEAIGDIASFLDTSSNEIFGVATFYSQFRFTRPGRHTVHVCLRTACHVKGGGTILETVEKEIGVEAGGTTGDYKFSLERVACFGSCALAPVVVIDKDVFGRVTTSKIKETLKNYD
ncbi:MAG: NADH-quinone oxidoreductase subunit NuoE [Dehalococcoidia bacterium]|nr:NADH-quinone oxidoreductase subunit NuoE [Dehalococcoidia bacterium]